MLKVTGIGNLGKDPTMRYTANNATPVTDMSIGTNRTYTDSQGNQVTESTWVRVTVWGKLAEACNNCLKKGSRVYFEGRLNPDKKGNPRTFELQDGTVGASYEVTADTVEFLSSKAEDEARANKTTTGTNVQRPSSSQQPAPTPQYQDAESVQREEIPF